MVRNGMDASEAWKIIVNDYASGQPTMLDRGDPYAPWSPTRTWSGAIGAGVGAGITGGIMAAFNLNRMKPDIIKTTDANCPEYGLYLGKRPEDAKYTPKAGETTQPEPVPAANPTTNIPYTNEGGIGIGFLEKKGCSKGKACDSYWIAALAEGGPAKVDGKMRIGDKILEIDNQPVKGKTPYEVRDLIGGKIGTYVVILIEISGKPVPVTLKRVATSTLKLPSQ